MQHSAETLARIEAAFYAALAAEGADRVALIADRCGRDPALITEVQSLLDACEAEQQATAAMGRSNGSPENASSTPRRIGPYEIDRLLGRGGMGAVYLAHRADGQFDQQVAIKLIDLPLATEIFRERFRQERQILAGLQHPLIARLLDGGVTAEGDLYLAMEYVEGVPIHRFCEENKLTLPRRLELFRSVCSAVQFAHQSLVVHRDLKPDNILVAKDGTPRLLDFGTAKLLSPNVDASSDMTRQGYQTFTPRYASPEQVLGNPITTASDTYSLGVLLYLLLTGESPYELKEFSTATMVRVICEQPPRKPVFEAGTGRRLDPDLGAILLKALRKEPLERYLTAEQFATDVQRYLEGQPVTARRGTFRYRAGKFVRRHRMALAAAGLLAATLIAGLAGIAWQARIANAQRRRAESRSEDLRQLSNSLLSELDEAIQQLPGSTQAQKLLVTTVMAHLDRMAKDASNDPLLQMDMVNAYTRLANVQGNPYDQNIGNPPGALATIDKGLAIAKPLARQSHNTAALHALAWAQQSHSEILFGIGRTQEAVAEMRAAAALYDDLASRPGATVDALAEAATAYGGLGDELGQSGTGSLSDPVAALAAYQHTLEMDRRILKVDPAHLRARRGIAVSRAKIANIKMETDPAAALEDYTAALEAARALPPAARDSIQGKRLLYTTITRKLGSALKDLGRYEEALRNFEQVRAYNESMTRADPSDTRAIEDEVTVLENEAECYEERQDGIFGPDRDRGGDAQRALPLLTQARALLDQLQQRNARSTRWRALLGGIWVRIAIQHHLLHHAAESRDTGSKGVSILKEVASRDDTRGADLDQVVSGLTTVMPASLREPQLGVKYGERLVELSHREKPGFFVTLAYAYQAAGQADRARSIASEGLKLLPVHTSSPGRVRKTLEMLAKSG